MSQPYVGEVRLFPYNFAPNGWFDCDGRLLSIAEYEVLYTLLGTTYGGDGVNTFGLPNLCGRVPIHQGTGLGMGTYVLGQIAGTARIPTNGVFSGSGALKMYGSSGGAQIPINVLDNAGQTLPHSNLQPYLVLNFCIALNGVYPSRS